MKKTTSVQAQKLIEANTVTKEVHSGIITVAGQPVNVQLVNEGKNRGNLDITLGYGEDTYLIKLNLNEFGMGSIYVEKNGMDCLNNIPSADLMFEADMGNIEYDLKHNTDVCVGREFHDWALDKLTRTNDAKLIAYVKAIKATQAA